MTEKVITLFDGQKKEIVGLVLVEEIEYHYINDKVVLYLKQGLEYWIIPFLESFTQKQVNTPSLIKKLTFGLKQTENTQDILVLEPYTLESDNKNKSSRNKRMIEQLNLPYKLERSCVYCGKKSS
jgi:hypothetical protein